MIAWPAWGGVKRCRPFRLSLIGQDSLPKGGGRGVGQKQKQREGKLNKKCLKCVCACVGVMFDTNYCRVNLPWTELARNRGGNKIELLDGLSTQRPVRAKFGWLVCDGGGERCKVSGGRVVGRGRERERNEDHEFR